MTTALDPYRPGDSLLHRLDARVKVSLTLAYILTTSLTPVGAWPIIWLLLGLALAAVILSEMRAGFVLTRTAAALPFVLAALPLLFTVPGTPLFSLPWGWQATREGLQRVAMMAARMWLSVLMAFTLTATTPFAEILAALRAWGLPKLLVAVVGLTWRYLFVLVDEAQRLMRARAARSGRAGGGRGGSVAWRARVTGGMAGNLMLRGTERAERIYGAMSARGYDGAPRVLAQRPLSGRRRALAALGWAALALVALAGLLIWG